MPIAKTVSPKKIHNEKNELSKPTMQHVKPKECPICYKHMGKTKKPLSGCGHWMHFSCLKKHFKQECPICRAPQHDVKVVGTPPLPEFIIPPRPLSERDLLDGSIEDLEDPEDNLNMDRAVDLENFPMNHEFSELDKEYIEDVLTRLLGNEFVSEQELYQTQVAMERARTGNAMLDHMHGRTSEGYVDDDSSISFYDYEDDYDDYYDDY
jgi:hypothetical protein